MTKYFKVQANPYEALFDDSTPQHNKRKAVIDYLWEEYYNLYHNSGSETGVEVDPIEEYSNIKKHVETLSPDELEEHRILGWASFYYAEHGMPVNMGGWEDYWGTPEPTDD